MMKTAFLCLAVAATVAACGGGSSSGGASDAARDAHVCGYIVTDAQGALRSATADLQTSGASIARSDFVAGAKQVRQDISTLPEGDKVRVYGEAVAASYEAVVSALDSNSGLTAAANDVAPKTNALQTLCRSF